jgi:hypothetical protein
MSPISFSWVTVSMSSVWTPYKMKYIEKIERVQKRVTKQFPGMKNLSYPERLKKIGLPTLAYRRMSPKITLYLNT